MSCVPVTCTYYMVWQGKYSSSTCGCRSCSFSSFPDINIITPEEKLGCSEKRWMMQYSANPIMYVLVKCVASPPSLWTFVKHLLLYTNRIGQGLQRNLGGFAVKSDEWSALCYGLEWVEEDLSMWTFEQLFTFNNQAKPSVFAGHSSVLQHLQWAAQRRRG